MSETKADSPARPPIQISASALRTMSERVRLWTGWPKAVLVFGKTDSKVSNLAMCDHETQTITADPEPLLLNPNRVLLTVTPFRLRQEAVLTGSLLHEAGHARHSLWLNPTMTHDDGTPVTLQEFNLAKLMEEPRVEGMMARDADKIGATGLGWTMRAMAAHLVPPTALSMDPSQKVLDIISSWTLRAGRQIALATHVPRYTMPGWVHQFTSLMHLCVQKHLIEMVDQGADIGGDPAWVSNQINTLLGKMITHEDDEGTTAVDLARDVLALLFPETDSEEQNEANEQAQPGNPMCSSAGAEPGDAGKPSESESGDDGEGDEEGEDGEGNTEPEDDGSGDDPGAGDSGDDEDGEPEEDGEDGQGDDESDEQGDSYPEEGDEDAEPGDGDSASASSEDPEEDGEQCDSATDTESDTAKALAELEALSKTQVTDEAEDEAEQTPPVDAMGTGAGSGSSSGVGGGWRAPNADEREVQKEAERFLRDMIDASESTKRSLSDQPSATIDGAALSAWKAGGQVRAPHFFIRARRNVEPSPPIEMAILVDISASMDELQKPSALLSWSLAAAALDLRNFAGRGQQVKSCLIHWGDGVRVVQGPGEVLPGIRQVACNQGTSNMHGAMRTVADLMPGFFDAPERPVNRLIVQFTDWRLHNAPAALEMIRPALENGVNMLSVVPNNYSARWASLTDILQACTIQRGVTSLVKYNPAQPEQVWRQAKETLNAAITGETPPPSEGF